MGTGRCVDGLREFNGKMIHIPRIRFYQTGSCGILPSQLHENIVLQSICDRKEEIASRDAKFVYLGIIQEIAIFISDGDNSIRSICEVLKIECAIQSRLCDVIRILPSRIEGVRINAGKLVRENHDTFRMIGWFRREYFTADPSSVNIRAGRKSKCVRLCQPVRRRSQILDIGSNVYNIRCVLAEASRECDFQFFSAPVEFKVSDMRGYEDGLFG